MSVKAKATRSAASEINIQKNPKNALPFKKRIENGLMIAPSTHVGKCGDIGKVGDAGKFGKGEEVGDFSGIFQSKVTLTEFV